MAPISPANQNDLAGETSPYLQDHASNPVNWYPWCQEALEQARESARPIFLSVGYSACHWCHVMKRESFEDPEVAEFMNENFVNIKVDREERPEIDEIYMQAVQAMTGRGGWPLNVFLTPDLKPFYGGTYFPPEPRRGMPDFRTVLERVLGSFQTNRAEVEATAGEVAESLGQLEVAAGESLPEADLFSSVYDNLRQQFDSRHGGFGREPKFPRVMDLQLLCRLGTGRPEKYSQALEMVKTTLTKMARGGIYDQVGGGFSRYSTDKRWLVPHFEKMLYDNAQLVELYSQAYQLFDEPRYRRVVERSLAYVKREMTSPEGGFFSSQDAESEGEEGKYYVWSKGEFLEATGEPGELLADFFNVTEKGNFEGKNILHVTQPVDQFAESCKLGREEFQKILRQGREQLLAHRKQRVKPDRDEKILTSWNGLMIAGLARAGFNLDNSEYLNRAEQAIDFLRDSLFHPTNGGLYHTHRQGRTHTPGFLDDYAFVIRGLLAQFQATGKAKHLRWAETLYAEARKIFWDTEAAGYFYSRPDREDLLVRSKNPRDKARPSGNSEMVHNALRLGRLTGRTEYIDHARETLAAFESLMNESAGGLSRMTTGLWDYYADSLEVVVVGEPEQRRQFIDVIRNLNYQPLSLFPAPAEETLEEEFPILEGRTDHPGKAFVCRNGTCRQPDDSAASLQATLRDILTNEV